MNRLYGLLEAKNKYDEAKAKAEAKYEASMASLGNQKEDNTKQN